jgi:hypothetical protein
MNRVHIRCAYPRVVNSSNVQLALLIAKQPTRFIAWPSDANFSNIKLIFHDLEDSENVLMICRAMAKAIPNLLTVTILSRAKDLHLVCAFSNGMCAQGLT